MKAAKIMALVCVPKRDIMTLRIYENTFDTMCSGCGKHIMGGPKKTQIMVCEEPHTMYLCCGCVKKAAALFKAEDKSMGVASKW